MRRSATTYHLQPYCEMQLCIVFKSNKFLTCKNPDKLPEQDHNSCWKRSQSATQRVSCDHNTVSRVRGKLRFYRVKNGVFDGSVSPLESRMNGSFPRVANSRQEQRFQENLCIYTGLIICFTLQMAGRTSYHIREVRRSSESNNDFFATIIPWNKASGTRAIELK